MTPVLVAYGQVNQDCQPAESVEPVALMAAAARAAADPRVLRAVDAIRVVNLLSWRYRDPGLLLGQLIGASDPVTRYTGAGGNMPQSLVNQACLDIRGRRAGVVLLAGGETWRTRKRLKAHDIRPDWTMQDESVPSAPGSDEPLQMAGPAEDRIGLGLPSDVYPLFEEAVRVSHGESSEDHRRRIGALWAQFNEVAQHNPHAWSNRAWTADEIWRPGPDNRMISWPYTKLLNSNNMVDQAAAVVVTSAQRATELQIPSERWVFPWSGAEAHDTYALGERRDYHRSPAIRVAAARALALAGLGIDDIDLVDVYSCFPSAVQVAATRIGRDRLGCR
jgi:acetyl-CoA C-acetyltransferase